MNQKFQDNESRSSYGVIRGLHYQLAPYSQAKLVRVLEGRVYDVAVDLRKDSPTFGKWEGVELSGENKKQFLIPKGFAHGFSVLSETAVFAYKCDEYYHPEAEDGIIYNDPALNIDWKIPEKDAKLSEKDKLLPELKNARIQKYLLMKIIYIPRKGDSIETACNRRLRIHRQQLYPLYAEKISGLSNRKP
ncbi:dTDP-4-dehydrorhamnose 3,5-epimerase [Methanosarcina mazei Tuc01]|uniref:dTDP-4-dehydrorhamnose 3,5-epimerase n=1 Tax=Methanosarcina mazei Tuc01 TaxID=1236903 RepID=M1Q2W4_METMZ|nr:dTDP-4-dehydrorhamnose 3,5-epimerase [Methanosarcina mazei]AGF96605.1 dTDP-4-dehydrorhamnose 3,5-epimerase [Methanosarcina mazei Tuc01]